MRKWHIYGEFIVLIMTSLLATIGQRGIGTEQEQCAYPAGMCEGGFGCHDGTQKGGQKNSHGGDNTAFHRRDIAKTDGE